MLSINLDSIHAMSEIYLTIVAVFRRSRSLPIASGMGSGTWMAISTVTATHAYEVVLRPRTTISSVGVTFPSSRGSGGVAAGLSRRDSVPLGGRSNNQTVWR